MECKVEHVYYGKCPQCGRSQNDKHMERVDVICPYCEYSNDKAQKIERLKKTDILQDIEFNIDEDISSISNYSLDLYRSDIVITGITGCRYRICAVQEGDYSANIQIEILGEPD